MTIWHGINSWENLQMKIYDVTKCIAMVETEKVSVKIWNYAQKTIAEADRAKTVKSSICCT